MHCVKVGIWLTIAIFTLRRFLSKQDRLSCHGTSVNRVRVLTYVERLLATEAVVLVYPVWNEGFPAILKGFFDRVFCPEYASRPPVTARRRPTSVI
jgi:putative NADPH-quinone reductase